MCGTDDVFGLDGAGTWCAAPQAAAAVLWLESTGAVAPKGWQRVEAVRHALFASADKTHLQIADVFGQGLLRAADALNVGPPSEYRKQPRDRMSFPFWLLLLGLDEPATLEQQMLETEATQLALTLPALGAYLGAEEAAAAALAALGREKRFELVNLLGNDVRASITLQRYVAKHRNAWLT